MVIKIRDNSLVNTMITPDQSTPVTNLIILSEANPPGRVEVFPHLSIKAILSKVVTIRVKQLQPETPSVTTILLPSHQPTYGSWYQRQVSGSCCYKQHPRGRETDHFQNLSHQTST